MLQRTGRVLAVPVMRAVLGRATSDNNGYFYQTDFSHAGIVVGETTASMQVDNKYQSMSPGQGRSTSGVQFVNSRMERSLLEGARGGKIELDRDLESGVARITISHPEKANALSGSMMVDLSDAIQDLEGWEEGKAVILCGDEEGKNFCGGLDLEALESLDARRGGAMCLFMQNALSRLQRLPMISVAAIGGSAVGGGAELTTACDFRVMGPDARIRFAHAEMGLSPSFGGGARLVRLIGARSALKLLSSACDVSSREGLEIGLSDHTLPDSRNIHDGASDWLRQYTRAPARVVRAMKTITRSASELGLDQALQREKQAFTGLLGRSATEGGI